MGEILKKLETIADEQQSNDILDIIVSELGDKDPSPVQKKNKDLKVQTKFEISSLNDSLN